MNLKTNIIATVAGTGTMGFSGDGGPATEANFFYLSGIAMDSQGNLYIADRNNYRVRRIDTQGIVTTVAGNGVSASTGDGGPAKSASLKSPSNVAVDSLGNLFIVEFFGNRVRRVDTQGIITTVAGNGNLGFSGDGGPAVSATFNCPTGVAIDSQGNLYISDGGNHRVRRVDTQGIITTVAGTGFIRYSGEGESGPMTTLDTPSDVVIDVKGNLYISDKNHHRVRQLNPQGVMKTVAGNGSSGYSGDGGSATMSSLNFPCGLAVDGQGNVFFTESDSRVRRLDVFGVLTTVAGYGVNGFSGDNRAAGSACMNNPSSLAVDNKGNLFIADSGNQRVR